MNIRGKKFLVVGAGISGLLVATRLQRSGAEVKVLEKGRGYGGRMATRRMEGARLDHGAQFMTVRSEAFGEWVEEWKRKGVIQEWFRKAPWDTSPKGYPRYCGVSGMNGIGKSLGEDLDVERSVRIESTEWTESGWSVQSDSGEVYHSDFMILSSPLPQALELLRGSGVRFPDEDWDGLLQIDYEPSLSGLLILDGPSGLPEPGGVKLEDGIISWMGDNTRKGISPDVNAVTVHSTPDFARKYWDSPNEERLPLLLEKVAPLLRSEHQVCSDSPLALQYSDGVLAVEVLLE